MSDGYWQDDAYEAQKVWESMSLVKRALINEELMHRPQWRGVAMEQASSYGWIDFIPNQHAFADLRNVIRPQP